MNPVTRSTLTDEVMSLSGRHARHVRRHGDRPGRVAFLVGVAPILLLTGFLVGLLIWIGVLQWFPNLLTGM